MFGKAKKWKQPSVAKIEKTVSEIADRFGYGNVWLFGNYYIGSYSAGDDIQLMLDSSEKHCHLLGFMGDCTNATGLRVQLYLSDENKEKTEYILKNSKLIHHA